MSDKQIETASCLSRKRRILLFLNYFPGYTFVYPVLLRRCTLWLYPHALIVPSWMQFVVYGGMIISSAWLAWPLLQESYWSLRQNHKNFFKTCLLLLVIFYLCTILVNLLLSFVTQNTTSENQLQVIDNLEVAPFVTLFSSLIYAPICEEILFRGVFYRCIRPHMNMVLAVLISAFSFGFIHVMKSLLIANFNDLWYVASYALIGGILAVAYEKTDTIYGSMCLHFINNAIAFLVIIA